MISVDRDQPRHYGDAKGRYFSVSTVCTTMTGASPYGSELDKQRGTDLHAIFALAVGSFAGRGEPPTVPTDYAGYYQSMQTWIQAAKPEPVYIERPSVSSLRHLPFAGTPDLLAYLHLQGKRTLTLIDLKSGSSARWHAAQLLGYSKLTLYRVAKAFGLLYLHEDGSPATYERVKLNPRDWAAFTSALNLLIWRGR